MYVFCYQYLTSNSLIAPQNNKQKKKQTKFDSFVARTNLVYACLVICLIIGAVTPAFEFARGAVQVYNNGINDYSTDYIITLNRDSLPPPHEKSGWPPYNFIAINYKDAVFFKYFAREKR